MGDCVRLKKISTGLTALIVFTLFANAAYGLEWYSRCNDTNSVNKFMSLESCNATACEYHNISQNTTCSNGCSETLGACRADDYTQSLYALSTIGGVIIFSAIAMYISERTDTEMYVALNIIASVIVIFIAITDWFSVVYRTIFLGTAMIPITFIVFAYLRQRKAKNRVIE